MKNRNFSNVKVFFNFQIKTVPCEESSPSSENVLRIFSRESHQVRLDVSIHQEKNSIRALSFFCPETHFKNLTSWRNFSVFRERSPDFFPGKSSSEIRSVDPSRKKFDPTRSDGAGSFLPLLPLTKPDYIWLNLRWQNPFCLCTSRPPSSNPFLIQTHSGIQNVGNF